MFPCSIHILCSPKHLTDRGICIIRRTTRDVFRRVDNPKEFGDISGGQFARLNTPLEETKRCFSFTAAVPGEYASISWCSVRFRLYIYIYIYIYTHTHTHKLVIWLLQYNYVAATWSCDCDVVQNTIWTNNAIIGRVVLFCKRKGSTLPYSQAHLSKMVF